MSDYTQTTFFAPKDLLSTGNPDKIIYGAELDPELSAISTAIATKYDSADLSDEATAEALTSNTVLLTPLRLANVLQDNGGMAYDIQQLADPNADRILFWDDSAGTTTFLTAGTNLSISGTTLSAPTATIEAAVNHDNLVGFVANEHIDHTSVSILAGTALTGGGDISASRTLNVDETAINHDNLLGFVADEHVAHSSVTMTAGTGLSGGGTIAASRTFNIDIPGTTLMPNTIDSAADTLLMYDASAGTHYRVTIDNVTSSDTGFVATGRTLTAGAGLTGGGDLSANRTFNVGAGTGIAVAADTVSLSFLGLQNLTDPNDDRIAFWDDSAGAFAWLDIGTNLSISGTTISAPTATLEAAINHDNLVGFVADEHVAHSGVTLTAGTGLSGGGTIAASRTFNLDTNSLTDGTAVSTDTLPFYDVSVGAMRKASIEDIVATYITNDEVVAWLSADGLGTSNETTYTQETDFQTVVLDASSTYAVEAYIYPWGGNGAGLDLQIEGNGAAVSGELHWQDYVGVGAGTPALLENISTFSVTKTAVRVAGFVTTAASTTSVDIGYRKTSGVGNVNLYKGTYFKFIKVA